MNVLADVRHAIRSLYKARGFRHRRHPDARARDRGEHRDVHARCGARCSARCRIATANDWSTSANRRRAPVRTTWLFSVPEITDYRTASKTLSPIAEYSPMTFTMVDKDAAGARPAPASISGNYFQVMGLTAVAGRLTSSQDDGPGKPPVAVLSHQFWMEQVRRRSRA